MGYSLRRVPIKSSKIVKNAIAKLMQGKNLSRSESRKVMTELVKDNASEAQISAYLVALRMKGETVEEITGAAEAFIKNSDMIEIPFKNVVDTCGTGGDNLHTFNISTTAALVTAGAGVAVAKHGHRSVSSKCGSSDLLKKMGINIDASNDVIATCFKEVGIAFLFANKFNKSQHYFLGPRREIGAWTIFNLLGPLTNPARTKRQVIGVSDKNLMHTLAEVMRELGAEHIMVVHGHDGLDEISITGPTFIVELRNGSITEYQIQPEKFGLKSYELSTIQTDSCDENIRILQDVLDGKPGAQRDIVVLNAAAAIWVSGKAKNMDTAVSMAEKSIDTGSAKMRLKQLIEITNK